MNNDLVLIEDDEALTNICAELGDSTWLAVDTEFERIKTYYPELCLMQVANPESTVVIDVLAIKDLGPLFELLYKPEITKVFHSARQDLELFFHLKGSVPVPLFDTQIAAPLLGYAEGIGYGNLIKAALGIELEKGHTRTDWKRRPLNASQLRYAADDVIYLGQVYELFLNRLTELNKLALLDEPFAALADPEIYEPDPDNIWMKIRDSKRFSGGKLSVLQQLATWREITARQKNLPRKWVLANHVLIDMAQQLPVTQAALARIHGMDERALQRYGKTWLEIIEEAQQLAPRPYPKAK